MVGIVRRVIEEVITSSTRNRVASEIARGFESLTLRQKASLQAVFSPFAGSFLCTYNHQELFVRISKTAPKAFVFIIRLNLPSVNSWIITVDRLYYNNILIISPVCVFRKKSSKIQNTIEMGM